MSRTKPKCVVLFDMGRMRSHLCFRFLSTHPDIEPLWHPFTAPFLFGPTRMALYDNHGKKLDVDASIEEDSRIIDETYADSAVKLKRAADEAAEEGKIFMANEHCFLVLKRSIAFPLYRNDSSSIPTQPANPTYNPDEMFQTLTPIFVIRNPIFATPSNYDTFLLADPTVIPGTGAWARFTTLRTQRYLLDFFLQRDGVPPLVIDGDDVVWRTQEVGQKICSALGIDPKGLRERWEPVPEEKRSPDPFLKHFLKVSDDSTGIERTSETAPKADLREAVKKWKTKYGVEVAGHLRETVERNWEDWKYLSGHKV